jgi:fatty-acyl-CoA synthase
VRREAWEDETMTSLTEGTAAPTERVPVRSTMQHRPLTVTQLFEHGAAVHPDRSVVTWLGDRTREVSVRETAERVRRLAAGLAALGVEQGDVVATFCWNHQEHVEAYFAVPSMGAVLHQLNIRLFPDQLAFVIDDLGDRVVLVDGSLIEVLAAVLDRVSSPETFVVIGDGDLDRLAPFGRVVRYDDLLDTPPLTVWPELDEDAPAASCYTSGTTGNPKGVVYSHRSIWTHTFGSVVGGMRLDVGDRVLIIVPQFHANAWGLVHSAWIQGADLLLPGPYLQPEPLTDFIATARPTCSAAVPTVWNGVLALGATRELDLSSLEWVVVGGAPVPRAMIDAFEERYGIRIVQGWGMTEMSPIGAVAVPARGLEGEASRAYRARTGRITPGVDVRLVDDRGQVVPWDGTSMGEIQVRGPWITAGYHGVDASDRFDDGWLRTGDVGVIDDTGSIQLVDRTKDVIKSGGEWISSVDLENALMAHPDVLECAVIGVADERWDERPLACVVVRAGASLTPTDLDEHLRGRVASWWIPERYAFVDEVPKTSVGKFDKKVLRRDYEAGGLLVITDRAR